MPGWAWLLVGAGTVGIACIIAAGIALARIGADIERAAEGDEPPSG